MAVCGLKSVNLTEDTIEILGVHFSCNVKIRNERNFYKVVSDIQGLLKLWRTHSLTAEGNIIIFKTLAISRIVYLAL